MGFPLYRQEIRGEARPGEREFTRILQTVKGSDPKTGRATEARLDGLHAWDGGEPAAVVAGPGRGRGPGLN
jgi:hypothetical protein